MGSRQPVHRPQLRRRGDAFRGQRPAGGFDPATSLWFGPGATIALTDGSLADRAISNAYYGAFTDTFNITPSLSANVSGRFNLAQIDLSDKLGPHSPAITGTSGSTRRPA
jgi:hypothetical protein